MADFIKIFPFIFGAAISPVLLVTVLYILSRPTQPIKKVLVFLLASTVTISIITAVIFYSTQIRPGPAPRNDLIPHTIIGFLLLFLALDIYKKGPSKKKAKESSRRGLLGFFGIGVVLMITNFTTIAMIFEVALDLRQLQIFGAQKLIYLLVTVFFSILPILLPLIILLLAGKNSEKILDKLSGFMQKYAHIVTSVFFAILGAYVLLKPFL
jgi:hypothetical protein